MKKISILVVAPYPEFGELAVDIGIVSKSTQTSPTMHIPMFLVYSPVVLGSVLMIFHGIYLLLCHITGTPLPKERKNTST